MVKKYVPLLLTFALATTMSACNSFPMPTPTATQEPPAVTETAPPTPTVEPTATPYVPQTQVTPGWQNAGWYPIAPPESFFDAANALGKDYSHEGYPEWASRDVYVFGITGPDNARVCSVSAKNTSNLTIFAQTYFQPAVGNYQFGSLCADIPLTKVGTLPEGNVYSFAGGPENGVGYILVPSSVLSGNFYVSKITEDVDGNCVGEFTGEQITDPLLREGYSLGSFLELASSFPGVWGTPVNQVPEPQGSAPNNYDKLTAVAAIPAMSREKYSLTLSQ